MNKKIETKNSNKNSTFTINLRFARFCLNKKRGDINLIEDWMVGNQIYPLDHEFKYEFNYESQIKFFDNETRELIENNFYKEFEIEAIIEKLFIDGKFHYRFFVSKATLIKRGKDFTDSQEFKDKIATGSDIL